MFKSEEKGNQKGIDYWSASISTEEMKYYKLLGELIILQTDYQILKSDYDMNPDYFRNRAIVDGIRNAIAHGNITINKFVSPEKIDDIMITFKDIYEGEVTFELEISIRDFERLFHEHNITVLSEFLDRKQKTYKITPSYGMDMYSRTKKDN